MKIPKEAICTICKRIFCCEKCRKKHELKQHAIRITRNHVEKLPFDKEPPNDISYMLCPICANRPFPLREIIYHEMLEHIKRNHLPLHCQKCSKVYIKVDELRQFSKCMERNHSPPEAASLNSEHQVPMAACCVLNTTTKSSTQHNSTSSHTSPHRLAAEREPKAMTPFSIVDLQWQAKTKAVQDTSESISSFKNFSFISNSTSLRRSIGSSVTQVEVKGKLVRTTSTPVSHTEADSSKPKEQTFNVSAAQVSSIYNSNCETENEHSPVEVNADKRGATTTNPQLEAANLYRKFNGRTKIAAVTPLRQVMSKSIQKAFAEHGLPSYSERKTTRDAAAINDGSPTSPLDLRLSPALRRSQGDSSKARAVKHTGKVPWQQQQKQIGITERKLTFQEQLTTESIVISCTKHSEQFSTETINSVSSTSAANSVYETCRSFEIITSTELGESSSVDHHHDESDVKENHNELRCAFKFKSSNNNILSSITPINRLSVNSIHGKIIKFETPKVEKNKSECCESPTAEQFYTPNSKTPIASEENTSDDSLSLAKMTVAQNLNARFSPSRRPSIKDFAQSTAYNVDLDEHVDTSNDEVFLEKTKDNQNIQTKGSGFLKSIVNSVLRLPSLKDTPKLFNQAGTEECVKSTKSSIIKRCASIAGTLVRSTSLMDEQQLQTLKRKRTHTIDSQLSPYKSASNLESVSYLHSTNSAHELSSTKRFRIQPRKPIERMRNPSN